MESLAQVGDIVIYTGDTSHSIDRETVELLKTFFVPEREYEVREVGSIDGYNYYKFKRYTNIYPCDSFIKKGKEYIKLLYNLK